MRVKSTLRFLAGFAVATICFSTAAIASAWTGPSGIPPSGNTAAPLNVSNSAQSKAGGLAVGKATAPIGTLDVNGPTLVNSLGVTGNASINGNTTIGVGPGNYINFGGTSGSSGYGIWDSAGTLYFKNLGDPAWQSLQQIIYTAVGGTNPWSSGSGNSIYYNAGNVGIGTANPGQALDVYGTIRSSGLIQASSGTGTGSVNLTAGDISHTGYISWYAPISNTRLGFMGWDPSNVNLTLQNGAAFIVTSGKVGIGTASPASTLDVNGNIRGNDIYLNYQSDWISNLLNQDVRSGASPNFWNIYVGDLGWLSDFINQDVRSGASPTFGTVQVNGNLNVNGSASVGGSTVCTSGNGACGSSLTKNATAIYSCPTIVPSANCASTCTGQLQAGAGPTTCNYYTWNGSSCGANPAVACTFIGYLVN